jgi:hypothetical protein
VSATRRLERVGQARGHRAALVGRHLDRQAAPQELAEERVEGLPPERADHAARVAELAGPDAGGVGDVEVGRHGGRQQPAAAIAGQLLLDVVVEPAARRSGRRARRAGEDDAQRPALGLLHEGLDVIGLRPWPWARRR